MTKAEIARALSALPDGQTLNLVMFKHGTCFYVTTRDESAILDVARRVDALIGPFGGEGGAPGDFQVAKLKLFDGWLVNFCWGPRISTIVLPSDLLTPPKPSTTEVIVPGPRKPGTALTWTNIGLVGRAARNLDMASPEIVFRSWDPG